MVSKRLTYEFVAAFALATLACSGISCSGGGGSPSGPAQTAASVPVVRAAFLAAAEEVPSNSSAARGVAVIAVDPATKAVTGTILTTGIAGVSAHIHQGAKGVAGGVIIPLAGGTGGVWSVPGGSVLSDAQYSAFQANGLYVNVHTPSNPGGEIRGQIGFKVKYASLSASQETPATTSTATGIGALAVDPLSGDLYGGIRVAGLTGSAAHIHEAAAGTAGSIVIPLVDAGNGFWRVPDGQHLTPAQVASFDSNNLYFNIHTPGNPSGEIRGQINIVSPVIKTFSLGGTQEVPANASTATATATVSLDPATLEVRGTLLSSGLSGTGAHIHEGAPGVAGPIAVPFSSAGNGVWTVGPAWYFSSAQFASYQAGNLYANIHSAAYPGGEIRGQVPADATVTNGGGGTGSGGGGY